MTLRIFLKVASVIFFLNCGYFSIYFEWMGLYYVL